MKNSYTRGSEWRKWDLHIHTPASFHWQGGKRFYDMTREEKHIAFFIEMRYKRREINN